VQFNTAFAGAGVEYGVGRVGAEAGEEGVIDSADQLGGPWRVGWKGQLRKRRQVRRRAGGLEAPLAQRGFGQAQGPFSAQAPGPCLGAWAPGVWPRA